MIDRLSDKTKGKDETKPVKGEDPKEDEIAKRAAESAAAIQKLLDSTLNDTTDYSTVLNNISRMSGSGAHLSRFQDAYFGINRLPQVAELPMHKEMQGMIFFTRPELNLSYDNVAKVRQLSHLLVDDPNSAMGAIRLALDPTTQRGGAVYSKTFGRNVASAIKSNLTDMNNPYLSLLSNTCVTMSPPPDLGINLYTSPEGMFREQWIMNDSIAENHGYYDITCTFNNIKGNAVMMMFLTWILYMGLLRVGPIGPHGHSRITNRMDYFTRIERFKFDESGRFIEQWFHTGGSVPKSVSVGAGFGLNKLEPFEFENKDVSVQFGSVGAYYNDPIQLWEFNWRMMKWNTGLLDANRRKFYYKAPKSDSALTNWTGYPLINLATREMEWWIPKDEYKTMLEGIYDIKTYIEYLEAEALNDKSIYTPMGRPK